MQKEDFQNSTFAKSCGQSNKNVLFIQYGQQGFDADISKV